MTGTADRSAAIQPPFRSVRLPAEDAIDGWREKQGVPLKDLNDERARLRSELQIAYGEWLRSTDPEAGTRDRLAASANDAGSDERRNAKWLAYLAAKTRLTKATAKSAADA
jgi:hypothetical protein